MIVPLQQGKTLLDDIESSAQQKGFRLWWLGQSGFLLQWQGHHLLFDPYLSDSLTEKYANTDKPHERLTQRCLEPAQLGFVEVVAVSHNHTDHLDASTLGPLMMANADLQLVVSEANRQFVCDRLGCPRSFPLGLIDGESKQVGEWNITGIAAAHPELETDDNGRHKFLGYILKFGDYTLYHSGDTLLYDGLIERLKPHNVDVALVPINGNKPKRGIAGNMNGSEAAQLAKEIGAKWALPHHFEMFAFNTASPDEFVHECQRLEQRHQVLRCGEKFEFNG